MRADARPAALPAIVPLATMLADTGPPTLLAAGAPAAMWAGACLAHLRNTRHTSSIWCDS